MDENEEFFKNTTGHPVLGTVLEMDEKMYNEYKDDIQTAIEKAIFREANRQGFKIGKVQFETATIEGKFYLKAVAIVKEH